MIWGGHAGGGLPAIDELASFAGFKFKLTGHKRRLDVAQLPPVWRQRLGRPTISYCGDMDRDEVCEEPSIVVLSGGVYLGRYL